MKAQRFSMYFCLMVAMVAIAACGPPPATPSITVAPSPTRQPPTPTQTAVSPTSTPIPTTVPSATPTQTAVPPTLTPTATPIPSATPTQTAVPATPTATPIPASPAHCRSSIVAPTEVIHAVHMTGNWGTNEEATNTLPAEYFEYLRDLNVNWVGISDGLLYDDSMDSTVERVYSGVMLPTFTDDFLREMIRTFHQYGFCVYLTLAFEAHEAEQAERPVYRYWLGNPIQHQWEPNVMPEFWPWAIDHPDHQRFVAEFWETYTGQAVHFGQLAEEEGVALYSLGTETESLFRTRPSEQFPNDFGEELRVMVAAVREVYSGPLTYDMHYSAFTSSEVWGPGSDHLWEDLGLDVIGLSSYFPLVDSPPTRVLSVEELEESWEAIFQDYLIPLQAANPGRPIYFTEFGAADSVRSPHQPNIDNFSCRFYDDADENGLDDGEETQANLYQALFNVMDRHPGVVNGTFLWEMWMADDEQWAARQAQFRSNSVRGVLAEDVVRAYYGAEPRATQVDLYLEIPTPFAVEESLVIYDDALAEGWEMWPWQAEVDPAAESVVHSGQVALGVTPDPWGKVNFFNPLDISEYAYLEFYVNGGSQGGQELGIGFWDVQNEMEIVGGTKLCRVSSSSPLPPDEWVLFRFPLQHLDLSGKKVSILILNASEQPAPQFFLDDVRLVREGTP
jgi:hypothetical protein